MLVRLLLAQHMAVEEMDELVGALHAEGAEHLRDGDFFAVVSRSVSEDPLYECGLPLLNHCLFSPPYLLLSLQHLYCVLESLVVPVC